MRIDGYKITEFEIDCRRKAWRKIRNPADPNAHYRLGTAQWLFKTMADEKLVKRFRENRRDGALGEEDADSFLQLKDDGSRGKAAVAKGGYPNERDMKWAITAAENMVDKFRTMSEFHFMDQSRFEQVFDWDERRLKMFGLDRARTFESVQFSHWRKEMRHRFSHSLSELSDGARALRDVAWCAAKIAGIPWSAVNTIERAPDIHIPGKLIRWHQSSDLWKVVARTGTHMVRFNTRWGEFGVNSDGMLLFHENWKPLLPDHRLSDSGGGFYGHPAQS